MTNWTNFCPFSRRDFNALKFFATVFSFSAIFLSLVVSRCFSFSFLRHHSHWNARARTHCRRRRRRRRRRHNSARFLCFVLLKLRTRRRREKTSRCFSFQIIDLNFIRWISPSHDHHGSETHQQRTTRIRERVSARDESRSSSSLTNVF